MTPGPGQACRSRRRISPPPWISSSLSFLRSLGAALTLALLSGCLQDLRQVRLNPDGTGTLVVTRLMKTWTREQARKSGAADEFTEARKVIQALRTLEAFRSAGQDPERWRKAALDLKGFKHALEAEVTLEFSP